jgi:beta-lactamase regulating signal transducer with metallopeptidase domain
MRELFFCIINMSVTACYVIAAVLLVRLLLKKAPKKYSYLLWSAAAFRLVCPISFASVVSVFNTGLFNMTKAQSGGEAVLRYIPADIGQPSAPGITVGIPAANAAISEHFPDFSGAPGVNPIEAWITAGMVVWLAGLAALLGYSLLSYMRLRKRVATAVKLTDGVFEADGIRSPFVLGFLHPKIYIPFGLTEREKSYILRHEACHIERKDPIVKLAAFLILSLHWFNPLVWAAFALMTKDMEMSCDERVLSASGDAIKSDYSASLLSLAVGRRFPDASPLAFGESVVKGRIQNILRFKKPRVWLTVLSAVLCAAVIVSCAANPKGSGEAAGTSPGSPLAAAVDTKPTAMPVSSPDTAPAMTETAQPYGVYAVERSVYANPASSLRCP